MTASAPEPEPDSAGEQTPQYADVAPEALVQVGFVFRPHGIEGELKIDPEAARDPERFEDFGRVYLGAHPRQVTEHAVRALRYQQTKRGTTVLLTLDGIDSRDDAERVTKLNVYVEVEAFELGEHEYFVHELVGMEVVTEEGEMLGTVSNLMPAPAQDVFVIRQPEGGEAMIPAVDDFILEIDDEADRVIVRPIEGLIE